MQLKLSSLELLLYKLVIMHKLINISITTNSHKIYIYEHFSILHIYDDFKKTV